MIRWLSISPIEFISDYFRKFDNGFELSIVAGPGKYSSPKDENNSPDDFSSFEVDAKPTYDILYALQLSENEKVLDKLPQLYHQFLKEMGELYVLGELEKVDKNIFENAEFQEYVSFLKTMKNVITKVERERIKKELPTSYEKLTFEINDQELQNAIKKQNPNDF